MGKLEQLHNSLNEDQKLLHLEFIHEFANVIKERDYLLQRSKNLAGDNRLLRKRLFGSSSEKIKEDIPDQAMADLFNEFEWVAVNADPADEVDLELEEQGVEAVGQKPEEKKAGRKPLPAHLPRKIVTHELSPEERICACGCEMEFIGMQKSEELEYIPAVLQVLEHHCEKRICTACAKKKEQDSSIQVTSKTASKPAQVIPQSFASASLLAHLVVSKFCDHLPLYRQEQIVRRLEIDLSRQTMSRWMLAIGKAVIPLVNLMQEKILEYDVAYADETTIQVLNEPERRAQAKSYMWCFIGGAPDKRVIIYQYHPTRSGDVADQFFLGYQGGLHCDGYGGYNDLLKSEDCIGLNCWAHVRRKFVEALPNGREKGVSGQMVKYIRALYEIEASLKSQNASKERIEEVRQSQSRALLDKIKIYLEEQLPKVLPKSKLGEAMNYTLKRWQYLITYLEDGRYEIDNNRSERAIKPFVCGRKNWLFTSSVEGAKTSARLFSLIETAKAHNLNPSAYLTYLFKELPHCKTVEHYEALLPYNIQQDHLKFTV